MTKNGWRVNFRIWRVRRRQHAYDHRRSDAPYHWCKCGSQADRDWKWECVESGADITLSAMRTDGERRLRTA